MVVSFPVSHSIPTDWDKDPQSFRHGTGVGKYSNSGRANDEESATIQT